MFMDLDRAIETLQELVNGGTATYLEDYDNVFYGNMAKWVAFANTLRLRLATRVAYADEALYQAEAEKALASTAGFIQEDVVLHPGAGAWENPIYVIEYNFNDGDAKAGATIVTYMNSYNDPRRASYFTAGSDGKYYGVRMGAARQVLRSPHGRRGGQQLSQVHPVVPRELHERRSAQVDVRRRGRLPEGRVLPPPGGCGRREGRL